MLAVPELEGVNVLVQVAVPAVVPAANVQVVKVPVTPVTAKVTEPVGVTTVPGVVEVVVAVEDEHWWITTTGLLLVAVVVVVGWSTPLAGVDLDMVAAGQREHMIE